MCEIGTGQQVAQLLDSYMMMMVMMMMMAFLKLKYPHLALYSNSYLYNVRFEILTAVRLTTLFWVVAPCRLRYIQTFRRNYFLHLQGPALSCPDEDSTFLQNVDIFVRACTASQPRRTAYLFLSMFY
jgi:hypothetical protein